MRTAAHRAKNIEVQPQPWQAAYDFADEQASSAGGPDRQSPAAAREAAVKQAELNQQRAIDRYKSFARVVAVSVVPKDRGPDPFGLGRHLDEQTRRASPARTPGLQRTMTHRRH